MVLTKRICLTIKSVVGDHFLYSHDLNVCFGGDTDREKLSVITVYKGLNG